MTSPRSNDMLISAQHSTARSLFLFLIPLLFAILFLSACGGGGGAGSSGGGTTTQVEVKGIAQLGYIADGDVSVYSVSDLITPVCTTKTSSSLDPAQAGRFSCKLPNLQNNNYYVVVVTNGTDIDPNDDGIIDDVANRKALSGKVHLVASGEQLAKDNIRVTYLSDMVYRNLKDSLPTDSADAIKVKYQKRAGELIDDIDGDGEIGVGDISQFDPLSHGQKLKVSYSDIGRFYLPLLHEGKTDEAVNASMMLINPPKLSGLKPLIEVIESISPSVLNIPPESTIAWMIDGKSVSDVANYKFESAGTHIVKASIISGGKVLTNLEQSIVVTSNERVASLVVNPDAESTYYHPDNSNDTFSGVEVVVPKGALTEGQEITIEKVSINSGNDYAVSLKPHGLKFEKPVQITMPYGESFDNGNIEVVRYSESGERITLPVLNIDRENHFVTFQTDHFSTFSAYTETTYDWATELLLDNIKKRISWDGTDDELVKILDFKPFGDGVETTVYDYYRVYVKNIHIAKEVNESNLHGGINYYATYTSLFQEMEVNSDWTQAKRGLESVDAVMNTSAELGSVIATSIKLITDIDVPDGLDAEAVGEYAAKIINPYDPIAIGDSILKLANEIFWNHELTQYFAERDRGCVPDFNNIPRAPPCLREGIDIDESNGYPHGFYGEGYTNASANISKMTTEERIAFWKNADVLYNRYTLGKSSTDEKLLEMFHSIRMAINALEKYKHPSVSTYVISNDKVMYRGVPTSIGVELATTGIDGNATHVTLASYTGTNTKNEDHYKAIATVTDCGVNPVCNLNFTPDGYGSNLQYRITSLFENFAAPLHDFTISVLELYELKAVDILQVLSVENDSYQFLFEPKFFDISNQEYKLKGGYDCRVVLMDGSEKMCNNLRAVLSRGEIINNKSLRIIFSDKSGAFDFKNANSKGEVEVSEDVSDIANNILDDVVADVFPSLKAVKVNGQPTNGMNLSLDAGDTVEFEISGDGHIVTADFDGNGRYSPSLSSIELLESEKNKRYVQTFNNAGVWQPSVNYKDSKGNNHPLKLGSAITVKEKAAGALDLKAQYSISANRVDLSVISNKSLSNITWEQTKGTIVALSSSSSSSPYFTVPTANGQTESFAFKVRVTVEGKSYFRFVSFDLKLLGEPVVENQRPNASLPSQSNVVSAGNVIHPVASDPEGGKLSYNWSVKWSNKPTADTGSSATYKLDVPSLTPGQSVTAAVTLVVEDEGGLKSKVATATYEFKVDIVRQLSSGGQNFKDSDLLERGTSKTLTWTTQNSGNVPLENVALVLTTANAKALTVSSISPSNIANWGVGESKTFTVTVSAPNNVKAGEHFQEWKFRVNGKDVVPYKGGSADAYLNFTLKTNGPTPLKGRLLFNTNTVAANADIFGTVEAYSGNEPYTFVINWGDSSANSTYNNIMEDSDGYARQAIQHKFATDGSYRVTATVTDKAGLSTTFSDTITVASNVTTTQWQVDAHDIDTNEAQTNISFTSSPFTQDGFNLGKYSSSWSSSGGSKEYFVKYRLPVPAGLIPLGKKVRLRTALKASGIADYDRELAFKTSAGIEYTASIRDIANAEGGYMRKRNLKTGAVDRQVYPIMVDDVKNTKFYGYDIEMGSSDFNIWRQSDSRKLASYDDNVAGSYLTEVDITFKGNGEIQLATLQYDKNGDGTYGAGETLILSTPSKVVNWSSFSDDTTKTDTDADGMPDTWETQYGLNPNDPTDAAKDKDSDGYSNLDEFKGNSDPTDKNSKPVVTPAPTGKLNDTGITTCANATSNTEPCPILDYPGQDGDSGRDVTHNDDSDGHAGFSFTKISSTGAALPASATEWSCVKDNVTGLMWEIKQGTPNGIYGDTGLHDPDDKFTWYEPDATRNGGNAGEPSSSTERGIICYGQDQKTPSTWCNTKAYVDRVNAIGFCGAKDWRMPTVNELRSIVSRDRIDPTIDTTFFPDMPSVAFWPSLPSEPYLAFWSSSPVASIDQAWFVNFHNGYDLWGGIKGWNHNVRLVRNGQ
ncbi:MAG: DUF1566 domain-containing protein [Candidatus Thiothrix moscowensis]|nr:DUF1566 domain-containing protein [Candidatus Thiothrix moscowensis]